MARDVPHHEVLTDQTENGLSHLQQRQGSNGPMPQSRIEASSEGVLRRGQIPRTFLIRRLGRAVVGAARRAALRGSREGWARAFLPRLMNRSFFGLLRASLLRPSTPFFGTCFVWQQRGSRRQVASTRSTACARPAGAVTASHWRCDCDRSLCAPESRLWAVWCEERPTGKCRSTCRSSALQR